MIIEQSRRECQGEPRGLTAARQWKRIYRAGANTVGSHVGCCRRRLSCTYLEAHSMGINPWNLFILRVDRLTIMVVGQPSGG
jgi:hypothetical protein